MKALILAAVVAVASMSIAGAAEVKKDTNASVPVLKAMTDADMDKVVAGNNGDRGGGVGYGNGHGCNCGRGASQNNYHARF